MMLLYHYGDIDVKRNRPAHFAVAFERITMDSTRPNGSNWSSRLNEAVIGGTKRPEF
jgi:hypothetical protein